VLAGDLRNGGVLGVVIGIEQACHALDWELTVFDVSRSKLSEHGEGFSDGYRRAFALRPDGLVLVSGNIEQPYHTGNLARAERLGIPVVGWHVAPAPGPVPGSPVIVNVTTASQAVAEAAAALVIPAPNEPRAGVVVFTDTSIDFARHKSDQMIAVLQGCDRCTVLSVEDIPLTQTATLVPPAVRRLLSTYGRRWTHSLAINDLYYDDAIRDLVASDGPPPRNISAGDGSPAALLRIRHRSFQYASVAEPLLHQGWQLVDELHRVIRGQPPSGYVNPAYVVTQDTVARLVSTDGFLEPPLPYRDDYRRLWQGASDE
jgi:ribose transport system substrate-binding protein